MNSVYSFDQIHSIALTMRIQTRVTMVIMYFLYAAIINARALLHASFKPGKFIMDAVLTQQRIIHNHVKYHVQYKQFRTLFQLVRPTCTPNGARSAPDSSPDQAHLLLEKQQTKASTPCCA